ncbi:hypothetical protein RHGRI_031305 [Rhododendron griersonianum]|uniref:Uncharacterized protein n=1 Tax=Rhododendron griersonianum TaxID=479676 RepID=A0AAV6I855_9ERIC|nr:hypothetical protein RHGRI_031305 [Rhododendron griersonianum]
MSTSSSSIWFTVTRQEPSLVVPEEPTPRELKQLSDIDDQEGLRFQVPAIMFYKSNPFMKGEDPVSVIREGLAKTLSFYYPFAGRLVEGPNRKLLVDCTSEGVLFVEADAEVELNQLGDAILPGSPVTRFRCGGFTIALRLNHTMSDGAGLVQFLSAIAEFAQGKEVVAPSVSPVWQRELLSARHPPRITCLHHEYEQVLDTNNDDANSTPIHKPFFFSPKEIRAIRNHLPPHASASTFEVLTACLWRCRTRALALDPNNTVRVSCVVNGRSLPGLIVPHGYYGNVITYPAAVSKAGKVTRFRCGGFAIALRLNHTMSDRAGLVQFLSAIAEFAQGKEVTAPSVSPVWQRERLSARHPPRITCLHHEFEQVLDTNNDDANSTPIQKPFFFGPKEIRAIRNHLPPHASASTFEVLTACLWRCRTRALALDPNNTVRVSCLVNGRSLPGLIVPHGYYGNVITYPAAVSKAGKV